MIDKLNVNPGSTYLSTAGLYLVLIISWIEPVSKCPIKFTSSGKHNLMYPMTPYGWRRGEITFLLWQMTTPLALREMHSAHSPIWKLLFVTSQYQYLDGMDGGLGGVNSPASNLGICRHGSKEGSEYHGIHDSWFRPLSLEAFAMASKKF